MLDRGKLVGSVLLWLGNTDTYNDTDYDEYKVANDLLTDVLRQIKLNRRFLFNAVTVKLNLAISGTQDGEYKYNVPVGFLNHISPSEMRIEGKFIFSSIKNLKMKYCKEIGFNEVPDYMELVLRYTLAMEMCIAYSQYSDRLGQAQGLMAQAVGDVQANEVSHTQTYYEDFSRTRRVGNFDISTMRGK